MRRQTRSQRLYVYFGISMAILMGASLVFPLIRQEIRNEAAQTSTAPTAVPSPTVPAAPADFNAISFDTVYLHPSGLFTVADPTGWEPQSPSNNGVQAQINMRNPDLLSVIEAYVEIPATPVTTLQELSDHFNTSMLEAGWHSYSDWRETGRKIDADNNKVFIDFELTQARQTYLARHVAWTDGKWIYVIRVVTTPNMRDLLLYLIDKLPPTLQPNPLYASAPGSSAGWTSFYNPGGNEIIRYPSGWSIADGRAGFPVSIQGLNNQILRIDVPAQTTIADEAAAKAYVEQVRPGVTASTVKAVTRNGGSGFAVSFNSTTLEGVGESGLMVLLNGDDGLLHAASVRVAVADVDLNNLPEGSTGDALDAAGVIDSFNLTTGLNLPLPTPTPTATFTPIPPTPLPTESVATEATAATQEPAATEDAATPEVGATTEPTPAS